MKKLTDKSFKKIVDRLTVISYLSYKEYLSDLFKACKHEDENFTHKDFAAHLGFARTNNTIRLVIGGSRLLTEKAATSICRHLGYKSLEKRYFIGLVAFNNERLPREREMLFAKLLKLKSDISPKSIDEKQLRYFEQWYNPIIREMMSLKNLDTSPEGIQASLCFPLRLDEIKRSLELLQEMGVIRYDKIAGRYEKVSGHISTDDEVDSLSVTRYHQKMIEMGKDAITRVHEDLRSVNAVTVSISKKNIPLLKAKINHLLDEILELEEQCTDPEDVYQVNVQMFPFTKKD
ncbi:MAG: TIGR02147 family protein [Oligoflexus sp.]